MKKQKWIQILFLVVFIGVMISGKLPVWMLIFGASFVAAAFFSRFYCGWVCPINTLTEAVNWYYKKKGITRKQVPAWVKSPLLRFMILAAFVIMIGLTLRLGIRVPVLPLMLVLGVVLTLFYVPELWHRYLCPYGTLLTFPGSVARKRFLVVVDNCTGCSICQRACPAEAVEISGAPKKAIISPSECLACTACAQACPTNAIIYGRGEA
ncbi:4Fe-4S binding protein [Anoxynatronum buryatiense]|uniref:4Fe-4S binding domain-containing protein n=1 Tax=Anoxynatronum buryatiense TaxID=489973 RepID=A0AA45WYE7_9CLOT|nr:4Fe-4S binding protein [Anoxynatronum buryatiense]SMP68651.1 4Fe-4S binding domain-containing protein [Anoxynatronum buryatiense]